MPVDRGLCEADVTSLLRRWVGDCRRIDVTDDNRRQGPIWESTTRTLPA